MENDEVNNLTEALGEACTGYDLGTVLTALTYLIADACTQSNMNESLFLITFNKHLIEAINELTENDNGNGTHH